MRLRMCFLAAAVAVLGGCSRLPNPEVVTVQEFDPYQRVVLGPVNYVTPLGSSVIHQEKGQVHHRFQSLPDSTIIVRLAADPPLSLQRDADRYNRAFLTLMDSGYTESVEYTTRGTAESVKVTTKGIAEDGSAKTGILAVLRQDGKTVAIYALGEASQRFDLDRAVEKYADAISFRGDGLPARLASARERDTALYAKEAQEAAAQKALSE